MSNQETMTLDQFLAKEEAQNKIKRLAFEGKLVDTFRKRVNDGEFENEAAARTVSDSTSPRRLRSRRAPLRRSYLIREIGTACIPLTGSGLRARTHSRISGPRFGRTSSVVWVAPIKATGFPALSQWSGIRTAR